MRFLQLVSVLAIAAPILAYPIPESFENELEPIENELEEETCDGPSSTQTLPSTTQGHSGILRPSPPIVEQSSSLVSSLTSELAPIDTSVAQSTTSSSSHRAHFSDPATFVPTAPLTTGVPTTSVTDSVSSTDPTTAPSDPSTSASVPSQKSTSTESSTVATSKPTTVPNPPASPSGFLRGINVGNWLVIEPWMDDGSLLTGQFKDVKDQWGFDSLDKDGSAIKKHWDTWFTEADVQIIKSHGFNALRIPIGFWAIDNSNTPYHKGAVEYMDKAIGWARNAGMKVLVDCHGSPGSQNGQMHSGHEGVVDWQRGDNLQQSTQILQEFVKKWGTKEYADVVFGIEIVNEPSASGNNDFSVSQSWAASTYNAMQKTIADNGLNKDILIITHDSFEGPTKFIPVASKLHSLVGRTTFGVDQHDYQLYTDADNSLDQPAHIKKACGWSKDLATTKANMPVIVGEWSALTNICVNSDGTTSPGPGKNPSACTGSNPDGWNKQVVEQVRRYVEAQLDTYEQNADGHFVWAYKAPGGWGVTNLIKVGAFPSSPEDRMYPNQCS